MIDWKDITVDYIISLHPSDDMGYQDKKRGEGRVKSYVTTIMKSINDDFEKFVKVLNFVILLERICLERGFNKIRMKKRCVPFKKDGMEYTCKMDYVAVQMAICVLINEKMT